MVIPFNKPSLVGEEINNIQKAISAGQLSGDGMFTKLCNSYIEEVTNTKKALLTHSGTAALEMAAMLCELGPGDEVIMPSYTFVSTANAVVLQGAVPVFVDIEETTLNIDPTMVEKAITPKTKAIFAVHYAGYPADMITLNQLARIHNLILVEDAAQAMGSTLNGDPAGSLADMAAFSFHETKNIISGEGGALTICNEELVTRAEIIREKGTDRSMFLRGQVDKYTWVDKGSSYLPGELIAAFLYAQLKKSEEIKARRLKIFDEYQRAFDSIVKLGRVRTPIAPRGSEGNGHMFYLLLNDLDDRSSFINYMKERGIVTPFHYIPLHSSPAGRRYGRFHGELQVTDRISDCLVRLPIYHNIENEIDKIITCALSYFNQEIN